MSEKYISYVRTMEDNPDGYYLIAEDKISGEKIASCCMFPEEEGRVDIGYCVKKEFWRRGLASEILEAIIDYIRKNGGKYITAEVADENIASGALLSKFGFVRTKKQSFKKSGTDIRYDSHIYRLNLIKDNYCAAIYVHGKGGNADEAEFYRSLFEDTEVIGFDYRADNPMEAYGEFGAFFENIFTQYEKVILVANSIGAYFSMHSLGKMPPIMAYLISPVVDMKKLIIGMMEYAGVSEEELMEKKTIVTSFGETLSWDYYSYVKNNPIIWNVPTKIIYGSADNLVKREWIEEFSRNTNSSLYILEGGEHWFHTEEQMNFIKKVITG